MLQREVKHMEEKAALEARLGALEVFVTETKMKKSTKGQRMAVEMGAVDIEVVRPLVLERLSRVQKVLSFASLRKQRNETAVVRTELKVALEERDALKVISSG